MVHDSSARPQGYYRHPTISGDTVIFVSENDLWTVPASGGVARRLTSGRASVSQPALSPDGTKVAFIAREEGNSEIYVMDAMGGPLRRLTYQAALCSISGWTPDGEHIVYASSAGQNMMRTRTIFHVHHTGGEPKQLGLGYGVGLAYGAEREDGARPAVLTRNQLDTARWKRYRGGTAGNLWVDADGSGTYAPILRELNGNIVNGAWLGDRVLFVSDHEGVANVYTCAPDGSDVQRLTHHTRYYARFARTDGARVVYQSGADLWLVDPASGEGPQRIDVQYYSPRQGRARRFVPAASTLQNAALHPAGHSILVTSRGKPFTMALWEGGPTQHGAPHGVRYRHTQYTPDGEHLLTVSDESGEEVLELRPLKDDGEVRRFEGLGIGRPVRLEIASDGDRVALTNHRGELVVVDLKEASAAVVARSEYGRVEGLSWSPQGDWIAYAQPTSYDTAQIRLHHVPTGADHAVTEGEFADLEPCFDPKGRYLYFLSVRAFDPTYDVLRFDLGYPKGVKLCLVTLRDDVANPFIPKPKPIVKGGDTSSKDKDKDKDAGDAQETQADAADDATTADAAASEGAATSDATPAKGDGDAGDGKDDGKGDDKDASKALKIDVEGIERRVLAFPIPEGRYERALQANDNLVFFVSLPIEGSIKAREQRFGVTAKSTLKAFDLDALETKDVARGISGFGLSPDRKAIIYFAGRRLRVVAATHEARNDKKTKDAPSRKSGWIDLKRLSVEVDPPSEWAQMLRESWRLMRDHFWTEDMSGVDWGEVYTRYTPLLDRIAERQEFSDLVWEMQGELGTSHAYEMGGDYAPAPPHYKGSLGVDLELDADSGGYRITRIVRGDLWDTSASSPLGRAGVGVKEGDVIVAVAGQPTSATRSVDALLVNRSRAWVELTVQDADGGNRRTVTVKTLSNDFAARYRDWVEANRRAVSEATNCRVGYIHVPDMGPRGYAEFTRAFVNVAKFDGLIVDVRFNGGGHVSQLLIQQLARRVVGYNQPRWGKPMTYPDGAPRGPIVALTNAYAGSDGDIFSHVFKLYKLGTLIGTRTWGGVIGIWPRHRLIDGSVVTQPEFSHWFQDVGWQVENYGTDPDIVVEYAPHDFLQNRDPQLQRGISEILAALEAAPSTPPDFGPKPSLRRPPLPGVEDQDDA